MSNVELYDAEGNAVDPSTLETPNVRQMRETISRLEGEAAEARTLQAKLDSFTRNESIRAAGLELDDVKRKALEAVHAGEWTPDALKQTAVQLGWAQPPPPEVPPAEQETLNRFNQAFTGSGPTIPGTESDEWDTKLAGAKTEAEFLDLYRQSGRPMTQ